MIDAHVTSKTYEDSDYKDTLKFPIISYSL